VSSVSESLWDRKYGIIHIGNVTNPKTLADKPVKETMF
jgi:hypothetical protein